MDWYGREYVLYAGGKLEELHLSSSAYLHGLIQAFCVQEDSRHEIWIGSSTGLYCYKEGAPTAWKHYTMKDGLPNDFIYSILEDERGRLWLTTNKGLACFNTEEGTFLNYTKQDGLPHDQFNYFGACKAHMVPSSWGLLVALPISNLMNWVIIHILRMRW